MEKSFNRGEILVRNIHENLIGHEKKKSNLIFVSKGSTSAFDQDFETRESIKYQKPNIVNIYTGNELGWGPHMVMSVEDFIHYVNAQHVLIKHDPKILELLKTPDSFLESYEDHRAIELANEIIHYAAMILDIFENKELDIPESVIELCEHGSDDILDTLRIIAGLESFDI